MTDIRLLLLLLPIFAFTQATEHRHEVFSFESEGYRTFRIPCLVIARNGTILAFAEGRAPTDRPPVGNVTSCWGPQASVSDSHCYDKDIVLKRSYDDGRSWTDVARLARANATYFYSNENAAVDPTSGAVHLQYSRCMVTTGHDECVNVLVRSIDNGETFGNELALGRGLGGPAGGWVMRRAVGTAWHGRVIMPQYYYETGMLFSDDGGSTWNKGNPIDNRNENGIAETSDGNLIMYSRIAYSYQPKFFKSFDGGVNWFPFVTVDPFANADCEMSITSFTNVERTILLASHPNTNIKPEPNGRQNLTIQFSPDDGQTWTSLVQIYEGPSAYSSVIQVNDTTAAVLFEKSPLPLPVSFHSIELAFFSVPT